jgi:hypothetical protein
MRYYPEAEAFADELQEFSREVLFFNERSVRQLLASDKYAHIRARQTDLPLQFGEMIWFKVNDRYNVGLGHDGRILWMVEGKRPE